MTNASAVSRALHHHAGIRTQPDPGKEGVRVTSGLNYPSVLVSYIAASRRTRIATITEAALTTGGYTYQRTDHPDEQLVSFRVTGRKTPR